MTDKIRDCCAGETYSHYSHLKGLTGEGIVWESEMGDHSSLLISLGFRPCAYLHASLSPPIEMKSLCLSAKSAIILELGEQPKSVIRARIKLIPRGNLDVIAFASRFGSGICFFGYPSL